MEFRRVIPPGPSAPPEIFYTGLGLADRAPAGRPYVVANFISSVDGKATADGRTASLGSPGDRAAFHLLRTEVDAVLAGTRTLFIENYGPLAKEPRLSQLRVQRRPSGPAARRGDQSHRHGPLRHPAVRRRRVARRHLRGARSDRARLRRAGDRPRLGSGDGALADVLSSLRADYDVRSLLCEGGPSLFSAMLVDGLVDELFLTFAPRMVGGDGMGITTGRPLDELADVRLVSALEQDGTLFLRYACVRD